MHGHWNASSERKLLLCIIGLRSKLKWDVIAQRMGEQFTDEACRYVDFFFLKCSIGRSPYQHKLVDTTLNFGGNRFPFSPESLLTIVGYLLLSLLQHSKLDILLDASLFR
jgi:hypothetical protein